MERKQYKLECPPIPTCMHFGIETVDGQPKVTSMVIDLRDKQGVVELRKLVSQLNKSINTMDNEERMHQIVSEVIAKHLRPGGLLAR